MVDLAAMVSSTLAADRKPFNAVLMMASNARKVRLVADVLPDDIPLTVLTSQTGWPNTWKKQGLNAHCLKRV